MRCFYLLALTACSSLASQTKVPTPPKCWLNPLSSIVQLSSAERGIRVDNDDGKPIESNEILLRVPLSEIITPQMGREETPAGRAICKFTANLDWHTALAIWICHAKANRENLSELQKWYIDTIPWDSEATNRIPLFWSIDDLKELDGSPLLDQIFHKRAQWEKLYEGIVNVYPPFAEETNLSELLQAKCLVASRAFRWKSDDIENGVAMIPLADMLNHQYSGVPTTCVWKVEDGDFVIRTSSELNAGSEAFQSYGKYANHHYLLKYGFCLEEEDHVQPAEAQIYLPSFGTSEEASTRIIISSLAEDFVEVLASLRLSEAKIDEEEQPIVGMKYRTPVSFQNERKVLTRLLTSIETSLSQYPTTLQKDLELLSAKRTASSGLYVPKFTNKRNAVVLRCGEKKMLYKWFKVCQACLDHLEKVEQGKASWKQYIDQMREGQDGFINRPIT